MDIQRSAEATADSAAQIALDPVTSDELTDPTYRRIGLSVVDDRGVIVSIQQGQVVDAARAHREGCGRVGVAPAKVVSDHGD